MRLFENLNLHLCESVNDKIVRLLENQAARFRHIGHPAEGKSEEIAKIRGTNAHQGAKAMLYKLKKQSDVPYVLAVLPGDMNVDISKIASHFQTNKKNVGLATPEEVEQITSCVIGTVPPIVFNEAISMIVDPRLLMDNEEIAFNAGRLDRSIILATECYQRIINPTVVDFSIEKKPKESAEFRNDASASNSSNSFGL